MKFAHLFILICFASAAFSQVPTSLAKDSFAADSIVFDYAAETDPEFPGGYDKLYEYISEEIQYPEFEKFVVLFSTHKTVQPKPKNAPIVRYTPIASNCLFHLV